MVPFEGPVLGGASVGGWVARSAEGGMVTNTLIYIYRMEPFRCSKDGTNG